MLPLVIAAKIGSCVAIMEYNAIDTNEPKIEYHANEPMITDPQSNEKYIIDFDNRKIMPYDDSIAAEIMKDEGLEEMIKMRK